MSNIKTPEEILRAIAYPKRGTKEEIMTLQDFADLIQSHYTIEDLEQFRDQENGGKGLEECKDKVAVSHGCDNWDDLTRVLRPMPIGDCVINDRLREAKELYASLSHG